MEYSDIVYDIGVCKDTISCMYMTRYRDIPPNTVYNDIGSYVLIQCTTRSLLLPYSCFDVWYYMVSCDTILCSANVISYTIQHRLSNFSGSNLFLIQNFLTPFLLHMHLHILTLQSTRTRFLFIISSQFSTLIHQIETSNFIMQAATGSRKTGHL